MDRVHKTRQAVGKFTRGGDVRSFSSGNVVILGGPTTWIIKLKFNYLNVYNRLDELLALLIDYLYFPY